MEGIGGDKIPTTLWFDSIDEFRQLADRDAFAMTRRLARGGEGIWRRLHRIKRRVAHIGREVDDPAALVVTILCDTGERYLSKVFNDEWMQENQMLDVPRTTVEQLLARRSRNAPRAGERWRPRHGASGAQPHEHLGA